MLKPRINAGDFDFDLSCLRPLRTSCEIRAIWAQYIPGQPGNADTLLHGGQERKCTSPAGLAGYTPTPVMNENSICNNIEKYGAST